MCRSGGSGGAKLSGRQITAGQSDGPVKLSRIEANLIGREQTRGRRRSKRKKKASLLLMLEIN